MNFCLGLYNTNPVFHFIFTLFQENAIPELAKISQEITGLDGTQLEALKGGFEGFDKENTGCINSTQSQMIFKMMGVQVQVLHITSNTGSLLSVVCNSFSLPSAADSYNKMTTLTVRVLLQLASSREAV